MSNLHNLIRLGQNPFQGEAQDTRETVSLLEECRVLVVGAGGLGNQILKGLALCGIRNIHVVDMDTLEITNLNRQILFREEDVGQFKAEVAARRLKELLPNLPFLKVTPHTCKIQDFDLSFFRQFNAVIAGLDNVEARKWLNAALCKAVDFVDDGHGKLVADPSTIIPLLDGGTEGFMGHCRLILPTFTSCFECTLNAFASTQETYPLCTVVDRPRLPEHCIEYALVVQWARLRGNETPDFDNESHITWLYDQAVKRAAEFGIAGVTTDLTLGVVKRIMPAIASTNQTIGFLLVNETIKVLTGLYPLATTYMMHNAAQGCHISTLNFERNADCPVCSTDVLGGTLSRASKHETLGDWIGRNRWERPVIRTDRGLVYTARPLNSEDHPELERRLAMTFGELISLGKFTGVNAECVYVDLSERQTYLLVRLILEE